MKYRLTLECPRCSKQSEVVVDNASNKHVNCGDCLMERVEIVQMTVLTRTVQS